MKRSYLFILISGIGLLAVQCSSNPKAGNSDSLNNAALSDSSTAKPKSDTVVVMNGINSKGVGRFKDVKLATPVDEGLVARGQAIFESKCFACHKLTNELLVGPGWKDVTKRRTPEWIMNWITNTKTMIDKDLAAQADMAVCLIRMPNQDLNDAQAREVLEFMRKNDEKN